MTNAEAWFNDSLRPRKPEGSLGRTAQDVHLEEEEDTQELCIGTVSYTHLLAYLPVNIRTGPTYT